MTKIGDKFDYRAPRGVQDYDPLEKPVWYGLVTPPQKERAAREYLKAQGLHAFYPDERAERKVSGKTLEYKKPIIARYVFARFRGRPNWYVIRSKPFFVGVISLYGKPYPIPRADVLSLMGKRVRATERTKALEERREAIAKALRERLEAVEAARMPVVGERAKLVEGPLSGFLVDVTRVRGTSVEYILPNGVKGSAGIGSVEREKE